MEVPSDATGTGWYVHSPEPGDPGPAVLAAHVDYGGVPGVFARLGDLRPGAAVTLRRTDGTDVAFVVDRVERYPKTAFPSAAVYGDTPGPELRLITCGGALDDTTGHYEDNVVAYARRV
jgi:sortase (surface protein transpeptidase)